MAVELRVAYQGDLRCEVTHGPSGQTFLTDAPVDNQGKGQCISPTDMVAAALGSCLLTTMGIVASRHLIDLRGTRVQVLKEMVTQPARRIGRLQSRVEFPRNFPPEERQLLERTALACPVHRSLHPDVQVPIEFVYPA
jgi:putative redox protein